MTDESVRIEVRNGSRKRSHIYVPNQVLNNVLLSPESLLKDYGRLKAEAQESQGLAHCLNQIEISGFDGTDLTAGEYLALFGVLEIYTRRGFENSLPVVSKRELFDSGGVKKDGRGAYQSADILMLLKGYRRLSAYNRPIIIKRYREDTRRYDVVAVWEPYLRFFPRYNNISHKDCQELEKRGLDAVALKDADSYQIALNPVFIENWGSYYSWFPENPAIAVRRYLQERGKHIKSYYFRMLAILGRNRQRSNKICLETLIERLRLERERGKRGLSHVKNFIEDELFDLAEFAGVIEAKPEIGEAKNGDVLYHYVLTKELTQGDMGRRHKMLMCKN